MGKIRRVHRFLRIKNAPEKRANQKNAPLLEQKVQILTSDISMWQLFPPHNALFPNGGPEFAFHAVPSLVAVGGGKKCPLSRQLSHALSKPALCVLFYQASVSADSLLCLLIHCVCNFILCLQLFSSWLLLQECLCMLLLRRVGITIRRRLRMLRMVSVFVLLLG